MSQYIASCKLLVSGQEETDFESISIEDVVYGQEVLLMNKTGYVGSTPRFKLSVDYVIPQGGGRDWTKVHDGQIRIQYEDGTADSFFGVNILSVGKKNPNGKDALKQTISFMAERKG